MKVFKYKLKLRSNEKNLERIFLANSEFTFSKLKKVALTILDLTEENPTTFYIEEKHLEIIEDKIDITKTMGINFKSQNDSITSNYLDKNSSFVMIYGEVDPYIFDLKVVDVIYESENEVELIEKNGDFLGNSSLKLEEINENLKDLDFYEEYEEESEKSSSFDIFSDLI